MNETIHIILLFSSTYSEYIICYPNGDILTNEKCCSMHIIKVQEKELCSLQVYICDAEFSLFIHERTIINADFD